MKGIERSRPRYKVHGVRDAAATPVCGGGRTNDREGDHWRKSTLPIDCRRCGRILNIRQDPDQMKINL